MKYKNTKGSVQETLLIPLHGRKMAMDLYPTLFSDRNCQELLEQIDFEAPKMSGIKAKIGAKEKPVILLLPGICRHWKLSFGDVISTPEQDPHVTRPMPMKALTRS